MVITCKNVIKILYVTFWFVEKAYFCVFWKFRFRAEKKEEKLSSEIKIIFSFFISFFYMFIEMKGYSLWFMKVKVYLYEYYFFFDYIFNVDILLEIILWEKKVEIWDNS